jgi:hypothetical protein
MQKKNVLSLGFNKTEFQEEIIKVEFDGEETYNLRERPRNDRKGKKPKVNKEDMDPETPDDSLAVAGCWNCYRFLMLFKTMDTCPFCRKETFLI